MKTLSNTDSYKLSHKGFMDDKTEVIYSNLTPRSAKHFPVLKHRYDKKVVMFGLQFFIIDYLIREWNKDFFSKPKAEVIDKFKRLVDFYLGEGSVSMEHFEELHDLHYLPIEIKAIPEGERVNIKVPLLTIRNTHKNFAWLTNYLETVMSCELWKPITTATIIREYRSLVNEYAEKTGGPMDFTALQLHDFSFRGMSGRHDAAINSAAFLLSSCGTDSIPAINLLEEFYGANIEKEFVATSVPASEHSIACSATAVRGELESYRKWITQDYPTGIVSLVSDTYDYWKVLTEYLPKLKEDILARPENALGLSKVVIRPDSGNPVDIICGFLISPINYGDATEDSFSFEEAYIDSYYDGFEVFKYNNKYYKCNLGPNSLEVEISRAEAKGSIDLLWEIFGGTINDKDYKELDSHIGLIYGDSITLEIAEQVFKKLEAKGFASTNVVFGVGSYTMNYLTRDSLGMAVKATYCEVDGKGYEIFKDPATDDGTKKSAKGLLRVEEELGNYVLYDQQTNEQASRGALQTVFKDGVLTRRFTLQEIRSRLWE